MKNNQLNLLQSKSSKGASPCYIALSPDQRNLFVANYMGGSITSFHRFADGQISNPQQFIQHLLNKKPPHYGHHKLIYDEQTGIKLSKASHAAALDSYLAKKLLIQVLIFLEMTPPSDLESESLKQIWQWAIVHWKLDALKSI